MYFAMDEIGSDNLEIVKNSDQIIDRWGSIYKIAKEFGFQGIQMSPQLYEEELGLPLNNIPEFMNEFRLTYHVGGLFTLNSSSDFEQLNSQIKKSFDNSVEFGMEDVSIHPPFIKENIKKSKDKSKQYFSALIEYWLPKFANRNISFSLETHVNSKYFIFEGLSDYCKYVSLYKELGILIDISHNLYEGYSEDEVILELSKLKITGLHLSDAITNLEFNKGTHLSIGKGNVDFKKIIDYYKIYPNLFGALEIKDIAKNIKESLIKLKGYL
jgi:sugar phosphate isomerase/epimerase